MVSNLKRFQEGENHTTMTQMGKAKLGSNRPMGNEAWKGFAQLEVQGRQSSVGCDSSQRLRSAGAGGARDAGGTGLGMGWTAVVGGPSAGR